MTYWKEKNPKKTEHTGIWPSTENTLWQITWPPGDTGRPVHTAGEGNKGALFDHLLTVPVIRDIYPQQPQKALKT